MFDGRGSAVEHRRLPCHAGSEELEGGTWVAHDKGQTSTENKVSAEPATGPLFSTGLWALLIVAATLTIGVLAAGYRNVQGFKDLGPWGDFAGGLLNPLLTFITFLAVLLTLWLQRQELSLTRDEMVRSADALEHQDRSLKKQSFENTFFEMLRLHNSILESIDLVNPETGVVTRGRDSFNVFYTRLTKIYRSNKDKAKGRYSKREIAELSYFLFWKDARTELGHYFRFLFNFFRFIETSGIDDPFYVKLLRSQLSDQELLILFYNNISEAGEPFTKYANLYELFDNLPVVRLLERDHAKFADGKSFGSNRMDFRPYRPRISRSVPGAEVAGA